MIDRGKLLRDLQRITKPLVEDLRGRSDDVDEVRSLVRGMFSQAQAARRTDRSYEEWREDVLAQVAVGWVLGCVFVRFCEDNQLVTTPLLSGPGERQTLARDHRAAWLAGHPDAGDREWLEHVFGQYRTIPATADLFGERNPLWQFGPTADGARSLLKLWWQLDDASGDLSHDFTDPELDTRFLGDLYQDLSEHAKKTFALLQTPEFVEEFILDRTLNPAVEVFGLGDVRLIDPACGSGHFLLGAFQRIVEAWREREPTTSTRELAQRALDAVSGVDINAFAVAIARFRLLLAALKVSRVREVADAPAFRIRVAVGDSLLHGNRSGQLLTGATGFGGLLMHRYPTEDEELANDILRAGTYQVVVGNPPYITVKEPALREAYRSLYQSCYRQYSLAVPFIERMFDLSLQGERAGFVGMIVASSFMKREFGRRLVIDYLPTQDLTHIIDTSGAHIPGHGTDTAILIGRSQAPASNSIRVVLSGQSEPGLPEDPSNGVVWTAIISQLNSPGSETTWITVADLPRDNFRSHPWSLEGGAARETFSRIAQRAQLLKTVVVTGGRTTGLGEDEVWLLGNARWLRGRFPPRHLRELIAGKGVRDWEVTTTRSVLFPYENGQPVSADSEVVRYLWPFRTLLASRSIFGQTLAEKGKPWWLHLEYYDSKLEAETLLVFATVATHNHFALAKHDNLFKERAPLLGLGPASPAAAVLGCLNSSVSAFAMRFICSPKGGSGIGRGVQDETWEERLDIVLANIMQLPLSEQLPLDLGTALVETAEGLALNSPAKCLAEAELATALATHLSSTRDAFETLRSRMIALQEELDWECYRLFGLLNEELMVPSHETPDLRKGERAFEIVLARRMADGDITTSWFERHQAEPTTELPPQWPEHYRRIVERRIQLIRDDRALALLERPEYKRRWNWKTWEELQREALRTYLLDRLEADELWAGGQLTTCAKLTDRLRSDSRFAEAAELYAGSRDFDIADLLTELILEESVPYQAGYRYKAPGLRKRRAWEGIWDSQRVEDAIDARTKLSVDDPNYLSAEDAVLEKKQQGLDAIPLPPKYTSSDFANAIYWRLRGKLDVPRERFVVYPGTQLGADWTPVIGWAGWDHLQQARAIAGHYHARKDEGAERTELMGLLAGLQELVPWLKQWFNDLDPAYGQHMGDFFESFADTEVRTYGGVINDAVGTSSSDRDLEDS